MMEEFPMYVISATLHAEGNSICRPIASLLGLAIILYLIICKKNYTSERGQEHIGTNAGRERACNLHRNLYSTKINTTLDTPTSNQDLVQNHSAMITCMLN